VYRDKLCEKNIAMGSVIMAAKLAIILGMAWLSNTEWGLTAF